MVEISPIAIFGSTLIILFVGVLLIERLLEDSVMFPLLAFFLTMFVAIAIALIPVAVVLVAAAGERPGFARNCLSLQPRSYWA